MSSVREDDAKKRTCQQCGMVCDDAGEFHPYLFCVLKKAGRDPWAEVLLLNRQLGLVPEKAMSRRPPLVRNLAKAAAR